MGTFQARIESIVGSIGTTSVISDWLTAGAKHIVDLLPPDKLLKYGVGTIDSGTGAAITAAKFLGAHKSYYEAVLIPKGLKARASDSTSRYYASTTNPSCYIDGGKAYVLPGGGTVDIYEYPTVLYSESSISNFPSEYDEAVVLYASIQGCDFQIKTNIAALLAIAFGNITTSPSAPLDAGYSYSNAALGTYTATTIGSLGTVPTYTPPTLTIDGTLWATAYPNYATQIATALTAMATQAGNGVTAAGVIATHLSNAGTRITTANTEIGLANAEADKMAAEIASAKAEIGEAATEIDLPMDSVLASIATASGRINTAVQLANVEFDKIPAIIDLANVEFDLINTDIDTASTTISTSQDFEKGQSELAVANQRATNGNTYIQEARERANNGMSYIEEARTGFTEVQAYVAQAGAKIQQITAQLEVAGGYFNAAIGFGNTAQRYVETATAYLNEVQKDIEIALGYAQQTTAYLNIMQGYSAEVQARLANVPMKVSEFNAKVNDAVNTFNKELSIYQSTVQSAIRQAELDQERLMLSAGKTTDLNIQNAAQTLNAAIELYRDKLGKYQSEISQYSAEANTVISKYQTEVQKVTNVIQSYQVLKESLVKQFNDFMSRAA